MWAADGDGGDVKQAGARQAGCYMKWYCYCLTGVEVGVGDQGGGRADSGSDERPEPEVLGTGLAETTEPVGDLTARLGPGGDFSPSKQDTIRR